MTSARRQKDDGVQTIFVETVAQYWDRRPCNVRHSPQPIGTHAYFDEVEQRKYFVEPHIPGFAQFERWKGKRVLEVGCGIGTDAVNFARAGAHYTGIELSMASLELTRQRFRAFGLTGQLLHANAEHLAEHFEAGHFDFVYSFGVIHHTPNPQAVIREVRKVIRPDGEFRLMLYAKDSWKFAMIEAGLDQPEAQSGCPIANAYTRPEARSLVEQAGFCVGSIEQSHIFPFVVEKYVQYEYQLQPWFAAMPRDMLQALERRFGWHMLIVAAPA